MVDWLDGATIDDLKARRRRHIYINPKNKKVDDDLKFFLDGGYILDDGSRSKIVPPTTVKRSRASSRDGTQPEQPRGKKGSE